MGNAEKQREYNRRYEERHPERARELRRARSKEYRRRHPDLVAAHNKAYRETHHAQCRAKEREYAEAHRQERNCSTRKWQTTHHDRMIELSRVSKQRYRARKAAVGGTFNADDIGIMLTNQKGRCWWCGKKTLAKGYQIDHRIPLSKGGDNNPSNLVLACPTCNRRKLSKLPHEFCGRLL